MADLIQELDGPRTLQQELFYDLEDASAVIGWAADELSSMAENGKASADGIVIMKVCALLKAQQAKLSGYADEVKAGAIVRVESGA